MHEELKKLTHEHCQKRKRKRKKKLINSPTAPNPTAAVNQLAAGSADAAVTTNPDNVHGRPTRKPYNATSNNNNNNFNNANNNLNNKNNNVVSPPIHYVAPLQQQKQEDVNNNNNNKQVSKIIYS